MKNDSLSDSWNLQNLEITSKSVERVLEPLVAQVSILVNHDGISSRQKGRSKQAETILKSIDDMLKEYLCKGEEIMSEAAQHQREFRVALDDVRNTGKELLRCSGVCLEDSFDEEKRNLMINSTKAMLSAVTRLMILADIIDVYLLLRTSNQLENCVQSIRNSKDLQSLEEVWKRYEVHSISLLEQAGARQKDLLDEQKKLQIAAARGILYSHNPLLLSSAKVFIRHPELAAAKSSRDYVTRSVVNAIQMINSANRGGGGDDGNSMHRVYEKPGEFATVMDEFDKLVTIRADRFQESDGQEMSSRLSHIVNEISVLSGSPLTSQEHQIGIQKYSQAVNTNLDSLIGAYRVCKNSPGNQDKLRDCQNKLLQSTDKLRTHLKRSVADHISDTYLNMYDAITLIVEAAKSGNEDEVESAAPLVVDKLSKLVEVADLACSVSSNYDCVRHTRLAGHYLQNTYPIFIDSARVLALKPSCKNSAEHLNLYHKIVINLIEVLTAAVDSITNIWDYLAVSHNHVCEDISQCKVGAMNGDGDQFYESALILRNRIGRICTVVDGEMNSFSPQSDYRRRVDENLQEMERQHMPELDNCIERVLNKLRSGQRITEADLETLNDMGGVVQDLWRAVIFGRDTSGYETDGSDLRKSGRFTESDSEVSISQENIVKQKKSKKPGSLSPSPKTVSEEQKAMQLLAGQYHEEIDREMAGFLEQKKRLMHEATKWDESANELVKLARQICQLLSDMTEFTRGRGPLQSTSEVIDTAGKISDCGTKFNAIAAQVAAQCPNSAHTGDLEKYMERVALYRHQIKITSRVKADIQNVGGEMVVSGLDSITSLIECGRNLMSAVVEALKASYIASTKYKSANPAMSPASRGQPVVQWRMKTPAKKPLIHKDIDNDGSAILRRSQRYEPRDPHDQLNEFDD